MIKAGSNLWVEEQEDCLMLSTICSILGREKCVQIGNTIYTLDNVIKIEELNMHEHEGKGAGSFYLECLFKELLRYPQIQFLYGELSPVNFRKKDKLLHFYRKNGFETIISMTEKMAGIKPPSLNDLEV